MEKRDYKPGDVWALTVERLRNPGLLLASTSEDGTPNVMTIGWATFGNVWAKPILAVLVRHSRRTFEKLEEVGDFTVNVPSLEMEDVIRYCGTVSGRDEDKYENGCLTPIPSRHICSPIIEECFLHFECRVVQKCDVDPQTFLPEIVEQFYAKGDFHRIYFGEVLAVYGVEDLHDRIGE